MPWCPICKNEYVEGIVECADCKTALVDSLDENKDEKVIIIYGKEEQMHILCKFLWYNEIASAGVEEDEAEEAYLVTVAGEDLEKAKIVTRIFLQQEAGKEKQEETEPQRPVAPTPIYEKRSVKAENFKSSAYTLTVVGILGIVFLLLSYLEVFSFRFGMLTYVGMGILFLGFTITGIHSFASYKKIAAEAVIENSLLENIKLWCKENITKDNIEEALFEEDSVVEDLSEEMKYFKRTEKMKTFLTNQFEDLEEGLLDSIIEEQYNNLYGE